VQATTAEIDAIESVLKLLHLEDVEVKCRELVPYVGGPVGNDSSSSTFTATQQRSFEDLGALFMGISKKLDEGDAESCCSTNQYPASVQAPMTLEIPSKF
jgi:hypothetical protein